MDNNQAEQDLAKLEAQLNETLVAERFFDTASGKLIESIIGKRVNLSLKKITGDDFLKDHTGYVNEVSWLKANQRLLKELQIAASPIRRAKLSERIESFNNE